MAEQLKCLYSSEIARFQYLLYLPSGYCRSENRRWPLLLFLHGWGESGDDLEFLKYHGVPKYLESSDGLPFIVIAPQASEGVEWQELTAELMDFLHALSSEYDVDPDQIYLTGLSTGGKGAWALAVQNPDIFAAVAPVAADIPEVEGFMDMVPGLRRVPTWVVHGERDDVYPLERAKSIVEILESADGDVVLTVVPGAGHVSWEEFYARLAFYEWLLKQSRRP